MIIEAVLENQIIGSLEDIEGAEDYQIIGSRTVPEDGDTKSEDNNSIGVIAVSVGYRSNDNFSLPMLSIPVTLSIYTRTEEDATGVKHETFVSSLASKLSFWHLHGDMMTAKFSSQKFLAG